MNKKRSILLITTMIVLASFVHGYATVSDYLSMDGYLLNMSGTTNMTNLLISGYLRVNSDNVLVNSSIDTFAELDALVADATLLKSGGTLTNGKICTYDGSGIDCDTTDSDTTYSESDTYLTLAGTVFGFSESSMNTTILAWVDAANSSMETYVDTQDSAQDECSEISGCIVNAYESITNFTGTLTDTKYCTYDGGNGEINCTSEGGVDTTCATSGTCATLYTDQYLFHAGDPDTSIHFDSDVIYFKAGNIEFARFKEASPDEIEFNIEKEDINFVYDGDTNNDVFVIDAGLEYVGIGTASPTKKLDVRGDINTTGALYYAQTDGTIESYSNGCYRKVNSSGVYDIC